MTKSVVIIGGGQAASSAAWRLRAAGFSGSIDILVDEGCLPYQRPPLSKKYLKGELEQERLLLRTDSAYAEQAITVHCNTRAVQIDRAAKRVVTDKQSSLLYDKLILATGATPRSLPASAGGELENVYTFRSLADADRLRAEMAPGKRLLVVGGGYIGLEMAAVAASLGLEVTLIELQERILNRVASAETAAWFRDLHLKQGVDLREGVALNQLVAVGSRASLATLSDDSAVGVDLVVVGIGVLANDTIAAEAGLATQNGIMVDEQCRTSDPDIYAVGDCAVFPYRGEPTRLESVQNACDQGEYVANHILGEAPDSYVPEPWFWSDQYDVSLKIAGLNRGYDRIVTRQGDKEGAVSIWYFAGERLLAVDAMNDPKSYMMGKRWLSQGLHPEPVALADHTIPVKDVPARAIEQVS